MSTFWSRERLEACAATLDLTRAAALEKDQAAGQKRARDLLDQEHQRRSRARYQEERCTCDEAPGSHTGDCPLAETLTGTSEPAPVTVSAIRAAILEPLGLAAGQLPAWGTPLEENGCLSCLLPAAISTRGRTGLREQRVALLLLVTGVLLWTLAMLTVAGVVAL